jgi:Ca2+-binding RTX toxin-like protein
VTVTVSATNDAPTVTVAAGGTCGSNDHSGTVSLAVADVEGQAAGLTLSIASSNPALVPSGNVVFGGSGTDRLTGGSGADRFSGGSGTDTATDFTTTEGDTSDGTIP